jgi:hypothetical protein
MSLLTTSIRPFWVPSLNLVAGRVEKGLSGWLSDSEFQIYSQIEPDSFVTHLALRDSLIAAFAADVNRCAMAAFESAFQIDPTQNFPKSLGWLVIKSYYAAFFAAHSLLRVLGTAFVQVDRKQAGAITRIADLFGVSNGVSVTAGYYKCIYDTSSNELECEKVNPAGGGVHEVFWSVVLDHVKSLTAAVLSSKSGLAADNQLVAAKLIELADNLSYSSFAKGNWLSHVRNIVNYNHRFGVWYPYSGQATYVKNLFKSRDSWLRDPMTINLVSYGDHDLLRFQQTCNFFVGACREIAWDMFERCPSGKSFLFFGSVALLNLMKKSVPV